MIKIVNYDLDSDENDQTTNSEGIITSSLPEPIFTEQKAISIPNIESAPAVYQDMRTIQPHYVDASSKTVEYNPKYDELFRPLEGPEVPNLTNQERAKTNILNAYVEPCYVDGFSFDNQRLAYHTMKHAVDPADGCTKIGKKWIDVEYFDLKSKNPKRKRLKNDDAADIDGYVGPWAKYVDEETISRPSPELQKELDVIITKRNLRHGTMPNEANFEVKNVLHLSETVDYMGRSFVNPPIDSGANLQTDYIPSKCYTPKKLIHTWSGHTKQIMTMKWFPNSAHLLLSCGMDASVKIWEVYGKRRCVQSYYGHHNAVRDVCFNNTGDRFLSAGYDKNIRLWDTETGQAITRFNNKNIPYCVRFNPDGDKQHFFLAGTSSKKILCWDTRVAEITQEYDRHLNAVNSITFVDNNRRFISTSDDKSIRIWEWNIPVDFKHVADPQLHSMPTAARSLNGKWMLFQSLDNKIYVLNVLNRFRIMWKKIFTGHIVSGYACGLDFSPDNEFVISGDADGRCFAWDFRTGRQVLRFKAHNGVCICAKWHPHETSKVVTCGWDNVIKLWD